MQADDGFLSEGRLNSQDIESPRSIFQAAGANKLASHAGEVAAFFKIDGVFRSRLAWCGFGPRFHLYECEEFAIVSDEVELAFDPRDGEIARDHDVTLTAEIPVSVSFTAHASFARELFRGRADGIFREAFAGGKIQNRKHELRKHVGLARLWHDRTLEDAA